MGAEWSDPTANQRTKCPTIVGWNRVELHGVDKRILLRAGFSGGMGAAAPEHPASSTEKLAVTRSGGAESGALGVGTYAEALALIAKFPLTDTERAETVRHLLTSIRFAMPPMDRV